MYTTSMDTDAHEYLLILNGLQRAIDKQEFVLHYQPQIDLGSGRVTGAEALIRWQHPDLGLIPPGRFIAIAEDSGLIVEIGSWVIRECCRQARRWQEAGFQDLTVAANVSALQFRRGSLEDVVRDALEEAGLEPRFLELELTESILADDQAKAAAVLTRLHEIGVGLALDDFGTGYSSFTYLVNFKLDKLKIDQSFVRNISMNHKDETIVSSIVRLAREFGLRTVAEGVESEQALEVVRRAGCDQAQGFLFARPMIADDLLSFLRARRL
jgi:EAL domain-containing protein (putative c-di-GMP-specific phosphodiesterase class I)